VHVDAAKSYVNDAKRNVESTFESLSNARFIIDDCMTFIDREVKRGNKYEGLIFDPPAFGRASNGKVWQIEKDLPVLIEKIPTIMSKDPVFVLITCHDIAWKTDAISNLIRRYLPKGKISCGDMTISSANLQAKSLPLGFYVRWTAR
jgi:23S rRNA (cytosine1962-C5)-methyltransferase